MDIPIRQELIFPIGSDRHGYLPLDKMGMDIPHSIRQEWIFPNGSVYRNGYFPMDQSTGMDIPQWISLQEWIFPIGSDRNNPDGYHHHGATHF
jgi:hypothetical protein